jgi:hypothetical protein
MSSIPKAHRQGAVAVLALTLPFLLTGCFKFTMDLEVSSDDKISGTAVVALSKELAGFADETGGDDATDVFAETEGVTASEFDDGSFVGQQYEFAGVPIEELDFQDDTGGLTITRDGDFLNVAGDLNFEDDSADAGGDDFGFGEAFFDSADLRVSIKFPGDVRETNGVLDEETNTVTWLPKYGQANEISATVYAPRGVPMWVWVLSASAVVALGITLGAVVVLRKRKGSSKTEEPASVDNVVAAEIAAPARVAEVEGVRFKYSIRTSIGPMSWLGIRPYEVMEVVLGRDILVCSFVDSKSGQVLSSETYKVSDISDAVFLSDASNGMVVRLTVAGGISDIPARQGDGKTLVGLLKRPQSRGETAKSVPEAPQPARPTSDSFEQIERLHELLKKGAISEEDFEKKKNEILKRL